MNVGNITKRLIILQNVNNKKAIILKNTVEALQELTFFFSNDCNEYNMSMLQLSPTTYILFISLNDKFILKRFKKGVSITSSYDCIKEYTFKESYERLMMFSEDKLSKG